VADGPRALILEQVTNGVAVRMAICYLLAGGATQLPDDVRPAPAPTRVTQEVPARA
jgi:aspartate carbamoyltransferase catalytic subunit